MLSEAPARCSVDLHLNGLRLRTDHETKETHMHEQGRIQVECWKSISEGAKSVRTV